MIDYEAATKYAVKFFQGDRASERKIPSHISSGVCKIIDAALPEGDLYVECEHLRDEDLCDVMCDAYVRGDGMVKVERGNL